MTTSCIVWMAAVVALANLTISTSAKKPCIDENGVSHPSGTHFYPDCNLCFCNDGKASACTRKFCLPKASQEDVSRRSRFSKEQRGNECQDESIYYYKCPTWARNGFCHPSSPYHKVMIKDCKKSCKACGEPSVDGNWGPWTTWSDCSATCKAGTYTRTRKCDNPPPAPGGKNCPGSDRDTYFCDHGPCPRPEPPNCFDKEADTCVSEYNLDHPLYRKWYCKGVICKVWPTMFCRKTDPSKVAWVLENCKKSCGVCQYTEPPVDGNWGPWGAWIDCSVTCDKGTIIRTRQCNDPPPAHGGNDCRGYDRQKIRCNEGQCPARRRKCENLDNDRHCRERAAFSQCTTRPDYMEVHCRRECGLC